MSSKVSFINCLNTFVVDCSFCFSRWTDLYLFQSNLQMLNFWLKNGLSSERLESFVLEYVGILGYPLSLLLFRYFVICNRIIKVIGYYISDSYS